MSTLERAIAIAAEAHAGQVDKGGSPYILHPLRVMLGVFTEEERIVAVLHDVAEDCEGWGLDVLATWFPPPVIAALDALTRRKGESYEDFIDRVRQNELARRVKLSDLADNSDTSRLNRPLTPTDRARLERYWRAVTALAYTGQQNAPPPIPKDQRRGEAAQPADREPGVNYPEIPDGWVREVQSFGGGGRW